MAKEKTEGQEARRKEKKDRKEKSKENAVITNGVKKPEKERKNKETKPVDVDIATKLLNNLNNETPESVAIKEDEQPEINIKAPPLIGALVPFANPLADEKQQKKVLKSVKKSAKNKTLRRGVKEVVKALRKSPSAGTSASSEPTAVIIIAADISPMDVISHIPVLCEDHGIPYIFVPSRVELGAAGNTKRPTSVVMVSRTRTTKKVDGEENEQEWIETYKDLVKLVTKAARSVRI